MRPVERAPVTFLLTAVYGRMTVKYGDRGVRYVDMEAGHAAQNLCLQAVALDLKSVVIGAFRDAAVKAIAMLPADEEPLYLIPVGK
jgi:SagB-type dehydrogenase family enzyme